MDARDTCPQIELACGDSVTALVLRHLEPLSAGDLARLRAFAPSTTCNGGCSPRGPTP
jgi:23S rRNA (uracil1939-C5)-methyltransferase